MEKWFSVAERFGLPVVMLLGMSYGMIQIFKWMANDLMKQINENHTRIEHIIIKLIDNSKQEREQNKLYFEKVVTMLDSTYTMMAKLYKDMPPEIQGVVIEMCYQMGFTGFCKFKKAIANMIDKNWKGAATEMLDSRWAKQTPNRANQLADIVREHG